MKSSKAIVNKRNNKIWIYVYSGAVLATAFLAGYLHKAEFGESPSLDDAGLGMLIWIISPLLFAILITLFTDRKWSDFSVNFKRNSSGFWWGITLLIYPVVFTVTNSVGLITGDITCNPQNFPMFFDVLLATLIFSSVKNIFEEFAWRGYLAPKVYREKGNRYVQHLFVGLVWGIWHIPFLNMFWPYVNDTNYLIFVTFFLLGTISQSIVYGEIRIKTESVLPAWLMHTIGSIFGTAFLTGGILNISSGYEMIYSSGTDSIIGSIIMLITGIFLVNKRKREEVINAGIG